MRNNGTYELRRKLALTCSRVIFATAEELKKTRENEKSIYNDYENIWYPRKFNEEIK